MIHYCVEVWGGKEISKSVFWPVFGSSEDWVKQLLNLWVNSKQPLNPEESGYAQVWVGRPEVFVFKLSEKSGGKKKGRSGDLIIAPPPYVPPNVPPPAPNAPPPPSDEDSDSDHDQPTESRGARGPVTRSQTCQTRGQLYPLREMPMGGPQPGIGFISVPLSSGDVREFKKEIRSDHVY